MAQVEFRFCAGSSCTWNAGTAIGTPDSSAPYAVTWSNQPADGQYTLVARATDNVGNTTDSAPVTVTVTNTPPDTTPPSTPVLTLTETIPEAHVAGSTLFYNPAAGSTSNVTVAASTTDAESAITKVAFPAVFGSDAVDDTSLPYSTSYSWSAGATASGETGHGYQRGGLTATSSFTVTPTVTGRLTFALTLRPLEPRSRTGKRSPRRRPMRSQAWPRSSSATAPAAPAPGMQARRLMPPTAARPTR